MLALVRNVAIEFFFSLFNKELVYYVYTVILFTRMYVHLRGNFMLYIHAYTYSLEEQSLCYLFTFLKGDFMSYILLTIRFSTTFLMLPHVYVVILLIPTHFVLPIISFTANFMYVIYNDFLLFL